MDNRLDEITNEIKVLLEQMGTSAWKAGMLLIGRDATIDQISNLLATQWGMDKDIIKNAMNRVKKPWI